MDRRIRTSLISIGADITLISIKWVLAWFTFSAALGVDALHSLSDLFVSVTVLLGLLIRGNMEKRAARNPVIPNADGTVPAPPGYWIEAIISLVVALIILYLPYQIVTSVTSRSSLSVTYPWLAIGGVMICILIAYFISRFKTFVGRETDSPALVADGFHSRMDMYTSIAVLVSLFGHLIGVVFDTLLAVVIAVLVATTGLELLITSLLSFVRRTRVPQIALLSFVADWLNRGTKFVSHKLLGRSIGLPGKEFWRKLLPSYWLTPRRAAVGFAVVLAAYALSGFVMIQPGETGVHLRFGAIVDDTMKPGLHYTLPWPIDTVRRVNDKHVYRVEVGFRTDPALAVSVSSLLWEAQQDVEGYTKNTRESIMLTGDENIVDISMVVHYIPLDPVVHIFRIKDVSEIVRGLTESIMRGVVAMEHVDHIMIEHRAGVVALVEKELSKQVADLGLGIRIVGVFSHDAHPPLKVVPSFRDVFSAREDKVKAVSVAESHRNAALPQARAQSASSLMDAEAGAYEKRVRAQGDAEQFTLESKAYRIAPDITSFRMYIETVENVLSGRKKIIADPRANRGGYRFWMFAPGKNPKLTGE